MVTVTHFNPRVLYQEGVVEESCATNWLCLVSTDVSADSVLEVPVTACGMGETQSQALRAATCNLIESLNALGYSMQ